QFHDFGERVRIGDGQVGERLAVQFDVGPLQTGDELAVAQAAHPASRVDARDPETAEIALACAPVAESVNAATDQGDNRLTMQMVAAEAEALGQLAQSFAPAQDRFAAACSGHWKKLQFTPYRPSSGRTSSTVCCCPPRLRAGGVCVCRSWGRASAF